MSPKPLSFEQLNETFSIAEVPRTSEHKQGFFIYDKYIGWNIAYVQPTKEGAFVQALEYYKRELISTRQELKELQAKVDSFLSQFAETEE